MSIETENTGLIEQLQIRVIEIRGSVNLLKSELQTQFIKEFNNGSTSHNRGLLYAQCGTNCQAILQLLNAIENDLELVNDLPLKPKENTTVQIF
jgi:hypothetical protein